MFKLFYSVVLLSSILTLPATSQNVKPPQIGQSSSCYLINESGQTIDLSNLCYKKPTPPTTQRTRRQSRRNYTDNDNYRHPRSNQSTHTEDYNDPFEDPSNNGRYNDPFEDSSNNGRYNDPFKDPSNHGRYNDPFKDPSNGGRYKDPFSD